MENNKKILIPTIVAVATLVLLVFGATYAYFTIESTNNFGTKELNATVEDMASAVVLEQVENTLSLDVTRAMMSDKAVYDEETGAILEGNIGTKYYASGSTIPANIAKMSVAGEGTYTCTYKINVAKSATNDLYTAFQGMSTKSSDQIYLTLNGAKYDFNTANLFPITYNGTTYGITKDSPQYITANLALLNKNVNQNDLKGKDITLTFSISDFNCELDDISEYTELAFTYNYMDDLGYNAEPIEANWNMYMGLYKDNEIIKDIVIPETFRGNNGVWYRVTSLQSINVDETYWLDINSLKIPKSVTILKNMALYGIDEGYSLYLPKNISFEDYALSSAPSDIYYAGSEAEWNTLVSKYESFWEYIGIYGSEPIMHYNVNY